MLANNTSGDSWKIEFVPLPWWTSQSRTKTRTAPSESSAWRAATARLAHGIDMLARVNRQELVLPDLRRLTTLESKPAASLELGLHRVHAVDPFGVAHAGLVQQRRGMAQNHGHGRRYGTGARPWIASTPSPSAPTSPSSAPAPPAC